MQRADGAVCALRLGGNKMQFAHYVWVETRCSLGVTLERRNKKSEVEEFEKRNACPEQDEKKHRRSVV